MDARRAMKRGAAAAVLFAVTSVSLPAHARDATVRIRDSYFAKSYRVVVVGDTVTWTNEGDREHTVVAYDGSFRSHRPTSVCAEGTLLTQDPNDCINQGAQYSHTFEAPGLYHYYCSVHGDPSVKPRKRADDRDQPCGMCGTIEVRERSDLPPPPETRSPTPTPTESPTGTASPSPTGTASPTPGVSPGASESPVAAPEPGGGGSGGRLAIAFLAITGLSLAGYATWRRFLATA